MDTLLKAIRVFLFKELMGTALAQRGTQMDKSLITKITPSKTRQLCCQTLSSVFGELRCHTNNEAESESPTCEKVMVQCPWRASMSSCLGETSLLCLLCHRFFCLFSTREVDGLQDVGYVRLCLFSSNPLSPHHPPKKRQRTHFNRPTSGLILPHWNGERLQEWRKCSGPGIQPEPENEQSCLSDRALVHSYSSVLLETLVNNTI